MKPTMNRSESKYMFSKKSIDRLSGVLLLLILVTSIVAAGLASGVDPVDQYNVPPERVGDVLQRVADNPGLHQAEIGFDLASFILTVALAGVLYFAFSPHDPVMALLGTLGLAAGGVILAVHDIPWFVLPSIAGDFVSASGIEAVALQYTGHVIIFTAMWGLSVGVTFLGLGALAYSVLMVWSKAVPRPLGWLGVVAGLLLSAGVWLPRIDESLYTVFTLLGIPYVLWELGLGVWLLSRGTREAEELATISN